MSKRPKNGGSWFVVSCGCLSNTIPAIICYSQQSEDTKYNTHWFPLPWWGASWPHVAPSSQLDCRNQRQEWRVWCCLFPPPPTQALEQKRIRKGWLRPMKFLMSWQPLQSTGTMFSCFQTGSTSKPTWCSAFCSAFKHPNIRRISFPLSQ